MMLRINFKPKTQNAGKNPYLYCRLRLNGSVATDFSTGIVVTPHWCCWLRRPPPCRLSDAPLW